VTWNRVGFCSRWIARCCAAGGLRKHGAGESCGRQPAPCARDGGDRHLSHCPDESAGPSRWQSLCIFIGHLLNQRTRTSAPTAEALGHQVRARLVVIGTQFCPGLDVLGCADPHSRHRSTVVRVCHHKLTSAVLWAARMVHEWAQVPGNLPCRPWGQMPTPSRPCASLAPTVTMPHKQGVGSLVPDGVAQRPKVGHVGPLANEGSRKESTLLRPQPRRRSGAHDVYDLLVLTAARAITEAVRRTGLLHGYGDLVRRGPALCPWFMHTAANASTAVAFSTEPG